MISISTSGRFSLLIHTIFLTTLSGKTTRLLCNFPVLPRVLREPIFGFVQRIRAKGNRFIIELIDMMRKRIKMFVCGIKKNRSIF